MQEQRSSVKLRLDALYRYCIWKYGLGSVHNIFVTEFPRSGGTWFCQNLSEILSMPFPRNSNISKQPCILHGHFLATKNPQRTIHLLRDGRDVVVSAYHYFLLNEENPKALVNRWRRRMPQNDLEEVCVNLSAFIKILFTTYRSGFKRLTWGDFVHHYLSQPYTLNIKYEELSQNPEKTMTSAIHWLGEKDDQKLIANTIKKYQFQNQSGRKKGDANPGAFLRKGIIGDWRNYFNEESAEVFNFYAGDALIRAGYEKDKQWC